MFCTNCGKENPDGNAFCESCGTKLDVGSAAPVNAAAETELAIDTAQFATAAQPHQHQQTPPAAVSEDPPKKKWPLYVGIGCGGLLVILIVVLLAIFVLPKISLGGGGGANYFYAVQENGVGEVIDAIYSVKSDGTKPKLVAEDRDGFSPYTLFNLSRSLSPDGKILALEVGEGDTEVVLFFANGDSEKLDDNLGSGYFSPDSKYYLTVIIDEDFDAIVFDTKGDEVFTVKDAIPIGFANKDEFVYIEFDYENYEFGDVGLASIKREEEDRLFKFDGSASDVFLFDGAIYYIEDSVLYKTGFTDRDEEEEVYEFDESSPQVNVSEEHGYLVAYDTAAFYGSGEMILIDRKGNATRIARDASASNYAISPDGKHIAYVESDSGGDTLYVVDIDGENEEKIASGNYLKYQFSPDSKSIVYLSQDGSNDTGTLYVSDLQGNDERLAKDVWDFMAADVIVYSILEDGELYDRPESVIYSIKYNGKGEKAISDLMEGLISFKAVIR